MTGYSRIIQQIVQLLMFFVTLALNTCMSVIPQNLQKAVMYVFNFVTSAGNWVGYLAAAGFYVAKELGYGGMVCQYSGYLTYIP